MCGLQSRTIHFCVQKQDLNPAIVQCLILLMKSCLWYDPIEVFEILSCFQATVFPQWSRSLITSPISAIDERQCQCSTLFGTQNVLKLFSCSKVNCRPYGRSYICVPLAPKFLVEFLSLMLCNSSVAGSAPSMGFFGKTNIQFKVTAKNPSSHQRATHCCSNNKITNGTDIISIPRKTTNQGLWSSFQVSYTAVVIASNHVQQMHWIELGQSRIQQCLWFCWVYSWLGILVSNVLFFILNRYQYKL